MAERPYQKLIAWQEAHKLCVWTYQITKKFPPDERFGLTTQMRRSSSSVPMNIAEGNVKRSKKDQAHFLETALGSLEELHYQYVLAFELHYIIVDESQKAHDWVQRVGFLTNKLRQSIL